jgi:hypothetical protein
VSLPEAKLRDNSTLSIVLVEVYQPRVLTVCPDKFNGVISCSFSNWVNNPFRSDYFVENKLKVLPDVDFEFRKVGRTEAETSQ